MHCVFIILAFQIQFNSLLSRRSVIRFKLNAYAIDHLFLYSPCRDGGMFKRIPVYRDPAGGTDLHHHSILTLCSVSVLYYVTKTMEKHSPELETMLRYPAFHVDRAVSN